MECDGDGLLVDRCLELALVKSSDVDGMVTLEGKVGRLNSAVLVCTLVGIGFLGGDAVSVVDVFEGMRREATIATVVVEVTSTVDQLLLRISLEDAILDQVSTFEASDC